MPFGDPSAWRSSVTSPAWATFTRDTTNFASGTASARVDITTASLDWYVQLLQPNLPLNAGQPATLSFSARASSNRTIRVAFHRNSAPYPMYAEKSIAITTGWQRYTFTFTPTTSDANALFAINLGATTGSVWLDDFQLTH